MEKFWGRFKKQVADAAEFVGEKATEFAGIAKIEIEIQKQKIEIKKLFTELGELVYTAYLEERDAEDERQEKIAAIIKKEEEIVVLEKELEEAKKAEKMEELKDTEELPSFINSEDQDDEDKTEK
ncbi:MAG: hypothetical protein N4A47_01205 [Clostridia bacterium]|jgi:hypothetical protein|nr:hypothetical protein [Clostridia bacterium]